MNLIEKKFWNYINRKDWEARVKYIKLNTRNVTVFFTKVYIKIFGFGLDYFKNNWNTLDYHRLIY